MYIAQNAFIIEKDIDRYVKKGIIGSAKRNCSILFSATWNAFHNEREYIILLFLKDMERVPCQKMRVANKSDSIGELRLLRDNLSE